MRTGFDLIGRAAVVWAMLLTSPCFAQERAGDPEPQTIDLLDQLRGGTSGVSADQVAERALAVSPSLEQSRLAVDEARAGAARTYLAFFPRLEFTGRYTRLSEINQPSLTGGGGISPDQEALLRGLIGTVADPASQTLFNVNLEAQLQLANFSFPVLLNNWAFQASLQYPLSDVFLQVLPGYEAQERAVDAAQHQVAARRAEIDQQARESFYNFVRAQAGYRVAQNALEVATSQLGLVQALVDAGTAPAVDLERVRAQVAAAEVVVIRARGGVALATQAVRSIVRDPSFQLASISENMLAELPAAPQDSEALIEEALSHRPEAEALRRALAARGSAVRAAEGSRYPHLVLAGNFYYQNPNQRIFPLTERFVETWDLSVILSWSPNDSIDGELRAAEGRAQEARTRADLDALQDGIRLQVVQAYTNFSAARESIRAAQLGLVAAEENLRVRTELYREGSAVLTELLAAANDRARAQLDVITASVDARIAWSQLQRARGQVPAQD